MRLLRRPGERHRSGSEVLHGPVERRVVGDSVPQAGPQAGKLQGMSPVRSDNGWGEKDVLLAGELTLREHESDHPHGDGREEVLLGR